MVQTKSPPVQNKNHQVSRSGGSSSSSAGDIPKTQYYDAIESYLDLQNWVCIRSKGQDCWVILNNNGSGPLQFVYEWSFSPFHETDVKDDDIGSLLDIFGTISPGEFHTVRNSISSDPTEELERLYQFSQSLEPKRQLLYESQAQKIKDLSIKRAFNKMHYVYSQTFTVSPATAQATDNTEKFLLSFIKLWQSTVTKTANDLEVEQNKQILRQVYDSWLDATARLEATGIDPVPQTGQDSWEYYWKRINGSLIKCPKLPHYFLYDLDTGFYGEVDEDGKEIFEGEMQHVTTQLFHGASPQPHREYVYLPNRKCYVGVCRLDRIPRDFGEPQNKYKWLWNHVVANPGISDIEFVTQLGWVDSSGNITQLQNYTKSQIAAQKKAQRQGGMDKQAEMITGEAGEAQEMLFSGNLPIYVGFSLLVYAKDVDSLKSTIRRIKSKFQEPARMEMETDFAWQVWVQSFPFRMDPLYDGGGVAGLIPQDFRHKINLSASIGLCQFIGINTQAKEGIEFISERGSVQVFISLEDEFGEPRHGAIFGKSGSGKSVMSSRNIIRVNSQGWMTTIIDLPDKDGNSTYTSLIAYLDGVFIDTGTSSLNPLERIDVRGLSEKQQHTRLKEFYSSIQQVVRCLIIENRSPEELQSVPVAQVKTILDNAVNKFYADPDINDRIECALREGLGTRAWENWPTLKDFEKFIDLSLLGLDKTKSNLEAVSFIKGALLAYLTDPKYSDCICKPSTYDVRKNSLVLFSLKSISPEDASIFGLLATQAALRRSMSSVRSLFYIDESSVLLDYPSLAEYVGVLFAVARKSGVSMLLAMQDPRILLECRSSAKLLANLSYKLVGRIAKDNRTLKDYEDIGIEQKYVEPNAAKGFQPSKSTMVTRWTIDDGVNITACKSVGYSLPLSLVLNGKKEVNVRKAIQQKYPDDPLRQTMVLAALTEYCFETSKILHLDYEEDAIRYCKRKIFEREEQMKMMVAA